MKVTKLSSLYLLSPLCHIKGMPRGNPIIKAVLLGNYLMLLHAVWTGVSPWGWVAGIVTWGIYYIHGVRTRRIQHCLLLELEELLKKVEREIEEREMGEGVEMDGKKRETSNDNHGNAVGSEKEPATISSGKRIPQDPLG
jgi:hypothetical protein